MLKVENVSKKFGEKKVLAHFSHTFPCGITCIMGKSGTGKTTMLNLIASLEKADEGRIEGVPSKLAFLFQEDRLCDAFSALRNVRLVTGRKVPDEVIIRHLQELGVNEQGPVSTFSGGMKRRVALVRTLLYGAPLILLDEPFKGLDGETKKQALSVVRRYADKATILCVTHDEEEVRALGANLLVLDEKA